MSVIISSMEITGVSKPSFWNHRLASPAGEAARPDGGCHFAQAQDYRVMDDRHDLRCPLDILNCLALWRIDSQLGTGKSKLQLGLNQWVCNVMRDVWRIE